MESNMDIIYARLTNSNILGATPVFLKKIGDKDEWKDVSSYLENESIFPLEKWKYLLGLDNVAFFKYNLKKNELLPYTGGANDRS